MSVAAPDALIVAAHSIVDLEDSMACVRVEVGAGGIKIWTLGDMMRAWAEGRCTHGDGWYWSGAR